MDKTKIKKIAFISLGVIGLFLLGFAVYYYLVLIPKARISQNNDAYLASLLQNDPDHLQDSFATDVQNGVNDNYTKSAAYFVLHRYFDNGGNLYEVYDFIEKHPELAFLKEAEALYPRPFALLKEGKLARTAVDNANYAHLGYLEVLNKHGYGDIALLGTAANQYARMSYFNNTLAKQLNAEEAAKITKFSRRDVRKSLEFAKLATKDVSDILDGKKIGDVPERDILVGLNQYAAALRYLEANNVDVSFSPKTAQEIFKFTMDYSSRYVPELNLFTSLLNATTLSLFVTNGSPELRSSLYPILDLDTKQVKLMDTSIIHKIINARLENPPQDIQHTNLGTYSK